jgi:hypothetical protein
MNSRLALTPIAVPYFFDHILDRLDNHHRLLLGTP